MVLFLPDRSLANYLLDFAPAALVAALSGRRSPLCPALARRTGPWPPRSPWALPAVASAVLLVVAFTSAPLAVTVDGVAAAAGWPPWTAGSATCGST